MRLREIVLDGSLREQTPRGTPAFPIEMYDNDIAAFSLHYIPWHWHDEVELLYMVSGELTVECGGRAERLTAGEGAFLNSGVLHAMRPLNEGPCRTLNIVFSPEIIGGPPYSVFHGKYVQPLLQSGTEALMLRGERDDGLLRQLPALYRRYRAGGDGYELETRSRLSTIWLELLRRCGGRREGAADLTDRRVKTLLTYIADHYTQAVTLEDIAASAGISVRTCCRCFRGATGMTPFQYLVEYRVKNAAQLLLQTDEPVTAICFSVGFSDTSYFSKAFRQLIGQTPTAFRRAAGARRADGEEA